MHSFYERTAKVKLLGGPDRTGSVTIVGTVASATTMVSRAPNHDNNGDGRTGIEKNEEEGEEELAVVEVECL